MKALLAAEHVMPPIMIYFYQKIAFALHYMARASIKLSSATLSRSQI